MKKTVTRIASTLGKMSFISLPFGSGLLTKSQLFKFGCLTVLLGLLEAFGISMVFPILRFVEQGSESFDAADMPVFWTWLLSAITAVGLPITLLTLLVMAFVPVLLRQVVYLARTTYAAWLEEKAKAGLRNQCFQSIIQSDMSFIIDRRQGELVSALTLEAGRGGELTGAILNMVGTLFLFLVYGGLLLMISPIMTLVALITAAVASLVVSSTVLPRSRRLGVQISDSNNDMVSSFTEELSGVRQVKMMAQEENGSRKVAGAVDRLRRSHVKTRILGGSVEVIVEPIFVLGLFSMIYVGVESLSMSLAALGTLMLVLLRMMPLAKALNGQRQILIAGRASLDHAQRVILEARASRTIVSGLIRFDGLKTGITFDHVSFRYKANGQDVWALQDVSFTIPRASMTAIVGRSGAGKSTLVDLIPRLKEADHGAVLIDGLNVKQLDLESLRRHVGFLSQEVFLFNDTIYNNIAYGISEVTPDQVREAARKAYAHDFIAETLEGYETIVGDRGVRLSAGQRQRLGIARIMLQNPDILILDEPTSALDSESEHYIQRSLDELRIDKTLIVIAHRLSTIQRADQIMVLDRGSVIESGDHNVLLAQSGDYSRLFELQIHI